MKPTNKMHIDFLTSQVTMLKYDVAKLATKNVLQEDELSVLKKELVELKHQLNQKESK